MKFKKIIYMLLSFTIMSIMISGCNSSNTSEGNEQKIEQNQKEYISEEQITELYTSPEKFKDKYVQLKGKVFGESEKSEGLIAFQMWADPINNERNTIVGYTGDLEISDGDYVIVDGKVYDVYEGKNAFGVTIKAPQIIADTVTVSDYQSVVAPANKTIEPNILKEQLGYSISLNKVDFADEETRLYFDVLNNGKSTFNVYNFNIKIIQENSQYEYQYNYNANYPEIQSDIMPNIQTSGIVSFPPIDPNKSFTVYVEGSSDDWNENLESFIFEVVR